MNQPNVEIHTVFLATVNGLIENIKAKHPGKDPNLLITEWITRRAALNEELCHTTVIEAFVLEAMSMAMSMGYSMRDKGPMEVAKTLQDMVTVYAHALTDRTRTVIEALNSPTKKLKSIITMPH